MTNEINHMVDLLLRTTRFHNDDHDLATRGETTISTRWTRWWSSMHASSRIASFATESGRCTRPRPEQLGQLVKCALRAEPRIR